MVIRNGLMHKIMNTHTHQYKKIYRHAHQYNTCTATTQTYHCN